MACILAVVLLPGAVRAQQALEDAPSLAATLVGRVCEDQDGDGRCGPQEPGIQNVRIVFATGIEVRTDAQGRYHLTGMDSRTPDATGGLHLRPGRHRLRVDTRTLPSRGQVSPEAVTVEVPWGAVVLQDFAVRIPVGPRPEAALAPAQVPPQAELRGEWVAFTVTGQARPGDSVQVKDVETQVTAEGSYRATVRLWRGTHLIPVIVTSSNGVARFLLQRIDAMQRQGSWLIAPREPELVGVVRLPSERGQSVPSGPSMLRVEAPEQTEVELSDRVVKVGPQGMIDVPIRLESGLNRVSVRLKPTPESSGVQHDLEILAEDRPLMVGLLDLEGVLSLEEGAFQLRGRGAAHGETKLGRFRLVGEVDLRDTDLRTLRHENALSWFRPRLPERFERNLDPERAIDEWGDDSITLTPNPAQGRLRLEAQHEQYGRVGLGTYRARLGEGEIGRYFRPLFGPFAEVYTQRQRTHFGQWWLNDALPSGTDAQSTPVRVGVNAFAGGLTDPVRGVSTRSAHEELRATGGMLYFLGASSIAEGSESLRIEVRDALTGLPMGTQRLVRGQDYEIDYLAGRILLARPLSFVAGTFHAHELPAKPEPDLHGDALTGAPEPVLIADYAVVELAGEQDAVGGEAWAEWSHTRLVLSGVREGRGELLPYQLITGRAQGKLHRFSWEAEVARSTGVAIGTQRFGLSDDGGLSFLRPTVGSGSEGNALGVRFHGEPFRHGSVDAAFRWREQGFSDSAHTEAAFFRQLSLSASQEVGSVGLSLVVDDRRSADPRDPFAPDSIAARTLGLGASYGDTDWRARLSLRDVWLRAPVVAGEGPALGGGRTSAELQGSWTLDRWTFLAGHRQALVQRGDGPGRVNDSFSSVGADVRLSKDSTVGLRGGWGPELGPRVWANVAMRRGPETYYGGYSVDVDGPDFGAGRAMMGARIAVDGVTTVFTEEAVVHDANAVRLGRAVGFRWAPFDGVEVGGRYERGVRNPLELLSSLKRDSGGVFGQLVLERLRVSARAEVRRESGVPLRGDPTPVDRRQAVVTLATEAVLRKDLSISGRVNFAHTVNAEQLEERLLEGSTSVAWRPDPFLLVARYSVTRELLPGERRAFGDRGRQVLSLLPAVRLGDRLAVAAGVHMGRSGLGSGGTWVWTGSLRPSVRVVGGLETAVEVARRTSAREGESLSSLRGEVGYRVDEGMRFAAGYTLLGFSGLGLSGETTDESNRLYLRAEMAY
ncbi:flagellar motor protein [Hyalangium gracile]|uniref:flagellar motor protein n=1 Tax=Hyalangium gracile TaxID=394092 RepID=UPI001CC8FA99|nr:flagellar motor protein [Hyalangium gracile]